MAFFYDTYVLIEIHKGNPKYDAYVKGPVVTSFLCLTELCYHFVRTNEFAERKPYVNYLTAFVVDISLSLVWKAMEFKYKHKKEDLSFADCIGYVYARENGIKFLTGDKKFEHMPFVEFVNAEK